MAEGDLLHAAERDRGGSALEIDGALGEPGHPHGRSHRYPVHLELRELEALLESLRHLETQVHRIAGGLTVGADEGEGPGRLAIAELDDPRFFDLVEGRAD